MGRPPSRHRVPKIIPILIIGVCMLIFVQARGLNIGEDSEDVTNMSIQNVSSADLWDALDTPADINAGDITDDGTYVKILGDDMTGNLSLPALNFTRPLSYMTSVDNYYGFGSSTYGDRLSLNMDANPNYATLDIRNGAGASSRDSIYWAVNFQMAGGQYIQQGSNANIRYGVYDSYTNDTPYIAPLTGMSYTSGVVSFQSRSSVGLANRQPEERFPDPHIRAWGGTRGQTTDIGDWIDIFYNVSDGIGTITTGDGDLKIKENVDVIGSVNSTGYIVNSSVGMSGNWSVGDCWIAFAGGIAYDTNCTQY